MKFLISGGVTNRIQDLKRRIARKPIGSSEAAMLEMVDFDKKHIQTLIRKQINPKLTSANTDHVNHRFTAPSLFNDKLLICSDTEVFMYSFPDLTPILEIHHPYFNDLHHVNIFGDRIVVTCTGLDCVMFFNMHGELLNMAHVQGKDVWYRRSPDIDYRLIESTKPHDCHPNFTFQIDGEIWVTRFVQKDAVLLSNPSERINIDVGNPHDGHVYGDNIYFTTTNGKVVIVNKETKRIEEIMDLNRINNEKQPLGWCRGLCLAGEYLFVGFTTLRTTKIEENVKWVKSMVSASGSQKRLPSRVSKYNIATKQMVDEIRIPNGHSDIIFGIVHVS